MARQFGILLCLLTISVLTTGCSGSKAEPNEPQETEETDVVKVEPAIITPVDAELNEPVSIPEESVVTEPNIAEPNIIELPEESPQAEPNEPKVEQIEPDAVESNDTEPNEIEPAPSEPNTAEPNEDTPKQIQPQPKIAFHNKCAEILSTFVSDDGMVDYSELRRKRLELKNLLTEFDELDPNEYKSWPKEDKIAFWINAYNIQMLNIIISNYPIEASRWLTILYGPYSIRHIKGIWTKYKFIVMDEEFTLSEVERRFFRKAFDDPRVFLALSRASLSSPPLRSEPYYGYKLDEQLNNQVKKFLSSPNGLRINRDEQTVYLSAIFESTWHGKDFISKFGTDKKFKDQQSATRAVLNFITNYISAEDAHFLEVGNYSVKFMKYDWTLNDSSRK